MARLLFLIAPCHRNSGIPFLTANQRNFNTVLFSLCFANFRVQFAFSNVSISVLCFFLKRIINFYTFLRVVSGYKKSKYFSNLFIGRVILLFFFFLHTLDQFFVKESRLTTTATVDSSDRY